MYYITKQQNIKIQYFNVVYNCFTVNMKFLQGQKKHHMRNIIIIFFFKNMLHI